jgi:hypothetical protein
MKNMDEKNKIKFLMEGLEKAGMKGLSLLSHAQDQWFPM